MAARLLKKVNATSLDQLRRMPASKLEWPDPDGYGTLAYIDGLVNPRHPREMYAAGEAHVSRAILGSTSMDGISPWVDVNARGRYIPRTPAAYAYGMPWHWGELSEQVLRLYPLAAFANDPVAAFVQGNGDASVVCPTMELARTLAARNTTTVYHYAFALGPHDADFAPLSGLVPYAGGETSRRWASHAAELPFVFHNACGNAWSGLRHSSALETVCVKEGGGWYPGMEQIADSMGQLWGSFARQGSPALPSGEGPVWAPLEAGGALDELPTLVLNDADGLTLDRGYRTQLCQFWTSALG